MLLNAGKQNVGQFEAFPDKYTHDRLGSFLADLAEKSMFILGEAKRYLVEVWGAKRKVLPGIEPGSPGCPTPRNDVDQNRK